MRLKEQRSNGWTGSKGTTYSHGSYSEPRESLRYELGRRQVDDLVADELSKNIKAEEGQAEVSSTRRSLPAPPGQEHTTYFQPFVISVPHTRRKLENLMRCRKIGSVSVYAAPVC
jgi:hypothetical protein